MKNILRNRTIIGITCIVVALAICFGLTPMYNSAITAKTEVLRVSKDILKGEVITGDMLQVVEIDEYNLPDTVIRTKEDIKGNHAYLYDFDGTERAISVTIKLLQQVFQVSLNLGTL